VLYAAPPANAFLGLGGDPEAAAKEYAEETVRLAGGGRGTRCRGQKGGVPVFTTGGVGCVKLRMRRKERAGSDTASGGAAAGSSGGSPAPN
jgi:hypothetical protein